jgi:hypothetical protein
MHTSTESEISRETRHLAEEVGASLRDLNERLCAQIAKIVSRQGGYLRPVVSKVRQGRVEAVEVLAGPTRKSKPVVVLHVRNEGDVFSCPASLVETDSLVALLKEVCFTSFVRPAGCTSRPVAEIVSFGS